MNSSRAPGFRPLRRAAWTLAAAWAAASMAHAASGAETLFSRCPSGLPASDVQGRAVDPALWQRSSVLAVFWSVDCPFCRQHNERLERLTHETPGAAVVGIVVDSRPEAVSRTVAARGYTFPVVVDGEGGCAVRPQLTPRRLVPMTCWLGQALTEPRCIPGEMSEDDLRDLLRRQARSSRAS